MKTNKLLILSVVVIAIVFAACSPAQVASGNYTLTSFSASNVPTTSGSAGTMKITENGADKVDILVSTSGNPDFHATGVSVTKLSVPGVTQVSFDLAGDYDVDGTYAEAGGVNAISLTIDNNLDTTYISVSGKK